MTHAFRIAMAAVCVLLAAGTHRSAFASSQTQTYALHMEVPQVSQAANGDVVSITGEGLFSIHPKTVSANGNFTHSDSQGNVLGSGTWVATQLLTFQPYGCGFLNFRISSRAFFRCSASLAPIPRTAMMTKAGKAHGLTSLVSTTSTKLSAAETFISRRISSTSGKHPLASCTFRIWTRQQRWIRVG